MSETEAISATKVVVPEEGDFRHQFCELCELFEKQQQFIISLQTRIEKLEGTVSSTSKDPGCLDTRFISQTTHNKDMENIYKTISELSQNKQDKTELNDRIVLITKQIDGIKETQKNFDLKFSTFNPKDAMAHLQANADQINDLKKKHDSFSSETTKLNKQFKSDISSVLDQTKTLKNATDGITKQVKDIISTNKSLQDQINKMDKGNSSPLAKFGFDTGNNHKDIEALKRQVRELVDDYGNTKLKVLSFEDILRETMGQQIEVRKCVEEIGKLQESFSDFKKQSETRITTNESTIKLMNDRLPSRFVDFSQFEDIRVSVLELKTRVTISQEVESSGSGSNISATDFHVLSKRVSDLQQKIFGEEINISDRIKGINDHFAVIENELKKQKEMDQSFKNNLDSQVKTTSEQLSESTTKIATMLKFHENEQKKTNTMFEKQINDLISTIKVLESSGKSKSDKDKSPDMSEFFQQINGLNNAFTTLSSTQQTISQSLARQMVSLEERVDSELKEVNKTKLEDIESRISLLESMKNEELKAEIQSIKEELRISNQKSGSYSVQEDLENRIVALENRPDITVAFGTLQEKINNNTLKIHNDLIDRVHSLETELFPELRLQISKQDFTGKLESLDAKILEMNNRIELISKQDNLGKIQELNERVNQIESSPNIPNDLLDRVQSLETTSSEQMNEIKTTNSVINKLETELRSQINNQSILEQIESTRTKIQAINGRFEKIESNPIIPDELIDRVQSIEAKINEFSNQEFQEELQQLITRISKLEENPSIPENLIEEISAKLNKKEDSSDNIHALESKFDSFVNEQNIIERIQYLESKSHNIMKIN